MIDNILKFLFLALSMSLIILLILSISEHRKMTEMAFKKCTEKNNKIMQVIDACVDRGRGNCLRYEKKEVNLCDYPKQYKDLIVDKL